MVSLRVIAVCISHDWHYYIVNGQWPHICRKCQKCGREEEVMTVRGKERWMKR